MDEPVADYSMHYRTWHDESPEHVQEMRAAIRGELQPLLAGFPRGTAADLGCGFGFAVLALGDLGYDAVGVERDPGQLEACRTIGVPVLAQDIDTYLDGAQDLAAVTLLDVLEHLPVEDHIAIMTKARRALRPGGVVVLSVPNALSPIAGYHRYIDHTHTTAFTTHSMNYVLKSAGFDDVFFRPSSKLKSWPIPSKHELLRSLTRGAWRIMIAGELGRKIARTIPIDLNLTVRATSRGSGEPDR